MSEYSELFKNYIDSFLVKDQQSFLTVAPPIFFSGSFDSLAIRIEKNEGGFVLSDCHTVQDYWDEFYNDMDKYQDKIQTICDKFCLFREERSFCVQTLGDDPLRVHRQLGYFLQALSLLANIDLCID